VPPSSGAGGGAPNLSERQRVFGAATGEQHRKPDGQLSDDYSKEVLVYRKKTAAKAGRGTPELLPTLIGPYFKRIPEGLNGK
jgi:hypothetical protein